VPGGNERTLLVVDIFAEDAPGADRTAATIKHHLGRGQEMVTPT